MYVLFKLYTNSYIYYIRRTLYIHILYIFVYAHTYKHPEYINQTWAFCCTYRLVFKIPINISLSHPNKPLWQKPSNVCQEYRVQLRTNFKMNLKSIYHQIFMPLQDYPWHFNYKHCRRGVLQILTLSFYNKLYWQPLSESRTPVE